MPTTEYFRGPRPNKRSPMFRLAGLTFFVILVAVAALGFGSLFNLISNATAPSNNGTWHSASTNMVLVKSGNQGQVYWNGNGCADSTDKMHLACLNSVNVKFTDNVHGIVTGVYGLDPQHNPISLTAYGPFYIGAYVVLTQIPTYADAIDMHIKNADAARMCRIPKDTFCS